MHFQNTRLFPSCPFPNVSVLGGQPGKSRSLDAFPTARLVPSKVVEAESCSGVGWTKSSKREVGLGLGASSHTDNVVQ